MGNPHAPNQQRIPPRTTLSAYSLYELENNHPQRRIAQGVESAGWRGALFVMAVVACICERA